MIASDGPVAGFEPHRARLLRLAYRMTGSRAEAEDAVQDTFLRWIGTEREGVREPSAFLAKIVARLCLDRLRARRREAYLGPWLAEPIVEEDGGGLADEVVPAMMLVLERLSPLERAAFLLHDAFGLSFEEIGLALGREAPACRQLASRARRHMRIARPRFTAGPDEARRLADRFLEASRLGDASGLATLLAEDVTVETDGGGRRPAALRSIVGRERAVALFMGLARKNGFTMPTNARPVWIDGLPGFVTRERDGLPQTTALATDGRAIRAVLIVRNPDKLGHVEPVAGPLR